MLPLDKLSEAAAAALVDKGLSLDDMSVAVRMDLDFDGNYGESWLVYEKATRTVHQILADPDSIPQKKHSSGHQNLDDFGKVPDAKQAKYYGSFSLDYYSDLTVDTCMSSNRLLVLKHDTLRPEVDKELEREEREKYSQIGMKAQSLRSKPTAPMPNVKSCSLSVSLSNASCVVMTSPMTTRYSNNSMQNVQNAVMYTKINTAKYALTAISRAQ